MVVKVFTERIDTLVAPGRVLTAAHVVAGASMVRVLLDVGQPTEVSIRAEGWWADPKGSNGTDLAVVRIAADANGHWAATEALSRLEALSAFDLAYIEQPDRARQHAEADRRSRSTTYGGMIALGKDVPTRSSDERDTRQHVS